LPDGHPATTNTDTEDPDLIQQKLPVAEHNKARVDTLTKKGKSTDKPLYIPKPINRTWKSILDNQGLTQDETRGITTSSARREVPSSVFGISTPGPIDKEFVQNQPVQYSRLGGTSIVMDDGDDKFIRRTKAKDGGFSYLNLETQDTVIEGEKNIPHNELFRIRTRTGHQILLHNSEDLVYIANANGTAWIEMTANGKIDFYAKDSVSIHSEGDFNFKADRDINIEAGRNINLKSSTNTHIESANFEIKASSNGYITTGADYHENIGANRFYSLGGDSHTTLASGKVDHSTPTVRTGSTPATPAIAVSALSTHSVPNATSIMKRVPQHEPWGHHENLDPIAVSMIKTDRNSAEQIIVANITNIPDTFKNART
jgi:hypothetical protein